MAVASRYSRQEILSLVGKKGQQKLAKRSVAVVGMGALGTAAAGILARSGIGELVLVDRDVVELTDLQRQMLYDEGDVGKPKAATAKARLERINSGIKISAAVADADHKTIQKLVGRPDVVLDCTDSLETRFLINEYCLKNKLAWVHAAAVMEKGQMMVFDFRKGSGNLPCFACVFGASSAAETCDTAGILSTVTLTIGAMQAAEALKLMLGKKTATTLLRLDGWRHGITSVAVSKNPNCVSCGKGSSHGYLNGKKGIGVVKMCGKGSYQIRGKSINLPKLKKQLQRMNERVLDFGECISFRNMTAFSDGRVLVKAESTGKAKADCARYFG